MKHHFSPKGVCSNNIEFHLDGNVVKDIRFQGGCHGNLQAIAALADGLTVEQIKDKLMGIKCGLKNTSCSDQLAHAIISAYRKEQSQ